MSETDDLEELMNLFEVGVDAFAICEIDRTAALRCDPMDKVVVHFVLRGSGQLEFEQGRRDLLPGTVIIVPRHFPKQIAGAGPVERVYDASHHCSLRDDLARFEATGGDPDLVLGCAAVTATIGGVIDIFEHLWEPMVEHATGPTLSPVFDLIEREASKPNLGSRAVMSALMKQVLIALFRAQLSSEAYRRWLWPAMLDRRLGHAAFAMMARPQDSHSVDSLAALAGMSRSSFANRFAATFGRSPIEFLQAVRLRAAQRLLLTSSLPVKSVAAAVGYSSRSHFSRSFQARFGCDPSGFRQRQQA